MVVGGVIQSPAPRPPRHYMEGRPLDKTCIHPAHSSQLRRNAGHWIGGWGPGWSPTGAWLEPGWARWRAHGSVGIARWRLNRRVAAATSRHIFPRVFVFPAL